MPWSIFSDGGGDGAAVTWAEDLLSALGAPKTPANVQFIYDWEHSEGGGGKYNPLNQGDVPGQPGLTTTGSQYGGGAADYGSYQDGIQGSVDYLHMPAYTAVLAGLMNGNNYQATASALWNSPWASNHYGYGSGWNTSTPPGASPLQGGTGPTASAGGSGGGTTTTTSAGNPLASLLQLEFPTEIISFAKDADTFVTGLLWLEDPSHWVRIVAFLAGVLLLLLALHAFTAVGTGGQLLPSLPSSVPVPVPV